MTIRIPEYDPYNLIITGVGGQGNVMASRAVGSMMTLNRYSVTIGETFGASQRGGSVMSHLRITTGGTLSPQIARGQANFIVALEPTEALRVLGEYGNPDVKVLCNTRPIYSTRVISGDQVYPEREELEEWIRNLSSEAWFIPATDRAMAETGNPIFANIILVGALAGIGTLPLSRDDFKEVISQGMPDKKVETNLSAFDMGSAMVNGSLS